MEQFNTFSASTNKLSNLVEHINQTCDALLSALEVSSDAVGNYGGGIIQQFDSEFVDRVVKALLKIKYHTARLSKEIQNGLISSPEELKNIVSGLLDTLDQLNTLMVSDGFMRNNFAFFIEELQTDINQILEEINIGITA